MLGVIAASLGVGGILAATSMRPEWTTQAEAVAGSLIVVGFILLGFQLPLFR
jgi:hypothetical protein